MLRKSFLVGAFLIATAAATPDIAQMQNGSMMAGHEKGMMSSSGDMEMTKAQMASMKRCNVMSHSMMMKNKKCVAMMKMHPNMMKHAK
jgi:hypothetical protein